MTEEREQYLNYYCATKKCDARNCSECDNCMYEKGRSDKYQEIVSEYMLLTEEQVNQIRTDSIDEFVKKLKLEPFSAYVMDIIYHHAKEVKGQK